MSKAKQIADMTDLGQMIVELLAVVQGTEHAFVPGPDSHHAKELIRRCRGAAARIAEIGDTGTYRVAGSPVPFATAAAN